MPEGQKRAPDLIIDGCKPPCGCWELNARPLEEQTMLLTTEPSLQLPRTSSCRPGWPRTHRDPTASASRVLGLKACATTAQMNDIFKCFLI